LRYLYRTFSDVIMKYFVLLLLISINLACKKAEENNVSAFLLLDAKDSGVDFVNEVEDQEGFNILAYRNYYNGGGVAIGDLNNDGLNDIYFTSNMGDNKLYLNKTTKEGGIRFEDITVKAHVKGKKAWCTGVTMADVNADGFLDIYVCYSGDGKDSNSENELFINTGSGLDFREMAKEYGLNDAGLSTHASFFDYDLDGDLDCYVLNNSYKNSEKISFIARENFDDKAAGGDRLYKNEKGKFINVTKNAGIFSNEAGFGLGISVGDVNGDFYPDLYISNDFWERDYLYINQKNGTFKDQLPSSMKYTSMASMGSDIADLNNDGSLDIFSTDMLPADNDRLKAATKFDDYYLFDMKVKQNLHYQYTQNCLQINQGDGHFVETANISDVAATDWSWGALAFDMNLDGRKDIFVSNGVLHDITDSDFVDFISDKDQVAKVVDERGKFDFRDFVKFLPPNKKSNFAFINITDGQVPIFKNMANELNLAQESFSNGSAYGDLDNDGDQDLVVNNVNMPAFIYENKATTTEGSHFLKFKFSGEKSNRFGVGAGVWLYSGGKVQVAYNNNARGFQSSVPSELVFGVQKKIDSARIVWPNLRSQVLKNLPLDKTMVLDYQQSIAAPLPYEKATPPVFEADASTLPISANHVENNYLDYDYDRLLPHGHSTEGPKMIKGDVNGDHLEDFILLGAHQSADKLFINTGNKFTFKPQSAFQFLASREKTAGTLFDADGDKDLDYVVAMGGNQFQGNIENFQAEYFENDGKGNFSTKSSHPFDVKGQISTIKPVDFDLDGDLDLFFGGRSVPGGYGLVPRSFLLQNTGNAKWVDITNEFTGPIGMVTDAIWSDINQDKYPDLIVVGEWMPIKVFVNEKGSLGKPFAMPLSEGWWNTLEANDIDGDGDTDFLLGNWGLNMKFKASASRPLNLYVNDFDGNKRTDPIITWFTNADTQAFPFASRMDLTSQMPALKRGAIKYHEFAKLNVNDLFEKKKVEEAFKYRVENFSSSILVNDKGNMVLKALPLEAQLSPVFSFSVYDFDSDGIKDFYAGGNFYKLKPEIGRHDGFLGGYFKGIGKGEFKYIKALPSGLITQGEVRDSELINGKLYIARNNASILVFKTKPMVRL
jgi:enediyne biosynthesis protein E4